MSSVAFTGSSWVKLFFFAGGPSEIEALQQYTLISNFSFRSRQGISQHHFLPLSDLFSHLLTCPSAASTILIGAYFLRRTNKKSSKDNGTTPPLAPPQQAPSTSLSVPLANFSLHRRPRRFPRRISITLNDIVIKKLQNGSFGLVEGAAASLAEFLKNADVTLIATITCASALNELASLSDWNHILYITYDFSRNIRGSLVSHPLPDQFS